MTKTVENAEFGDWFNAGISGEEDDCVDDISTFNQESKTTEEKVKYNCLSQ